MAKILLVGLAPAANDAFHRELVRMGHDVEEHNYSARSLETRKADLLFASGDDVMCLRLLNRVRGREPLKPFVIVSRIASDDGWIQALEAGATDYCSSVFDPLQLRWIIDNALAARHMTCAA